VIEKPDLIRTGCHDIQIVTDVEETIGNYFPKGGNIALRQNNFQ